MKLSSQQSGFLSDASAVGKTDSIINAMSVDVEDYFQVAAFESLIKPSEWDSKPCRVERNVASILELFDDHGVASTFFTLGWVADRYPALVRDIVSAGHELASHGYAHQRVINQTREEFRDDVVRTKCLLEDISGTEVKGYRAPSYSIGAETLWAHDVLAEAGYRYSSSVVPIKHDLYGIPGGECFGYRVAEGRLLEIPISTISLMGRRVNCGGGGWFRFFPYGFTQRAIQSINRSQRQACVFYFHPWEIDPGQPRIAEASVKSRFRHYLNLERTKPRLERLLKDFRWSTMEQVFLQPDSNVESFQSSCSKGQADREVTYVSHH